jgi:hypothetical protein
MVETPTVFERIVPVTVPVASVGAEGWDITSTPPRSEVSVTVFPETGMLFASRRTTVIVLMDVPFAGTLAGDTVTLLFPGSTTLPTRFRVTVALAVSRTLALTEPLAVFSMA